MKCAVIKRYGREINNLIIVEREDLVATGENVRIKVSATALNRADILQRRGLYPPPAGASQDIPGLEFVGYIDQVGDKVTEWKGGERVFGMVAGGSYAEQVVTHQRLVVPVPKELTDVEAAAVPEAFITAHDALVTQGGMKPGDLVLIHAVASGIGSAAVQLVNLWGAKAIGTAGSSDKLKKIEEFASFSPINYKRDNFKKIIEKEFGKNSIDLILDLIGASYWRENIALLKNQGLLILLGLMGGKIVDTDLSLILSKHLHIIGTVLRSRPIEEKISATQSFAHQVIPHLKNKKLKPVIDSVFPFDQLHKATFRMENNENVGKIILTI